MMESEVVLGGGFKLIGPLLGNVNVSYPHEL